MSGNISEFSVSELANQLKNYIEERFSYVKIKGEISGFKKHSSGHIYFSLKDDNAVISAIMWKGTSSKLSFPLEDGIQVIASGKITTYIGRSQYQIIVDFMQPDGVGALMMLLEKRKLALSQEGLFDVSRKKPIPKLPKVIGIITSETGAVIKDIIHRLKDRYMPHTLLLPVAVQGELAAKQVAYAIRFFNELTSHNNIPEPDTIIVARGGGSIEDLWCFNEEIVVRAIANSRIPIISAIGHETDFTLSDFVADLRAPTPTAAAEMAVPIKTELLSILNHYQERLNNAITNYLKHMKISLNKTKLPQSKQFFTELNQKFDFLYQKIPHLLQHTLIVKQSAFSSLSTRLTFTHLKSYQKNSFQKSEFLYEKLIRSIKNTLENYQNDISSYGRLIEITSYKSVLERGFAVVTNEQGKFITHNPVDINKGEKLILEFSDGKSEVKKSK